VIYPRQVVIPDLFKFDRRRLRHNSSSRYAISLRPLILTPLACFAFEAVGRPVRISLFQSERDACASPEKFRHRTPIPILLWVKSDNRLESVANAHTAADLHVRPEP